MRLVLIPLGLALVATPALAAKPKRCTTQADAVASRMYAWPDSAKSAVFLVSIPMLDGFAAKIEAGSNPNLSPEEVVAAAAWMRSPIEVHWDLEHNRLVPAPVPPPPVAHEVSSEALQQIQGGMLQGLGGVPAMLAMVADGFPKTAMLCEKRGAQWVLTPTDSFAPTSGYFLVDRRSMLVDDIVGPTPTGGEMKVHIIGWTPLADASLVPSGFSLAMPDGSEGGISLQWADQQGVWLPTHIDVSAGQVQMGFAFDFQRFE